MAGMEGRDGSTVYAVTCTKLTAAAADCKTTVVGVYTSSALALEKASSVFQPFRRARPNAKNGPILTDLSPNITKETLLSGVEVAAFKAENVSIETDGYAVELAGLRRRQTCSIKICITRLMLDDGTESSSDALATF
jgi:hypothetical protein